MYTSQATTEFLATSDLSAYAYSRHLEQLEQLQVFAESAGRGKDWEKRKQARIIV